MHPDRILEAAQKAERAAQAHAAALQALQMAERTLEQAKLLEHRTGEAMRAARTVLCEIAESGARAKQQSGAA